MSGAAARTATTPARSGAPSPKPDPADLVAWYDRHARKLPWRVSPKDRARGVTPDPYRVWLSEIMLQQTTVAAVKAYYEAFLERWPTVAALAAAPSEDVMRAWAGLGYYSRARNLKAAAEAVMRDHGGRFPETVEELRALPGIGDYTAAAIAAIAFDVPANAVDGNVVRVMARLFRVEVPMPRAKGGIVALAAGLVPQDRAGDYAQALMDLGATICTPKRPACPLCPWRADCGSGPASDAERYPLKVEKKARPTRHGVALVAVRDDGAVLLRRRPERGLLGGMSEVPGSDWMSHSSGLEPPDERSIQGLQKLIQAEWTPAGTPVVHVFTHFRLELSVHRGRVPAGVPAPAGHWWAAPGDLPSEALPSVMKKAIEAALPGATKRRR